MMDEEFEAANLGIGSQEALIYMGSMVEPTGLLVTSLNSTNTERKGMSFATARRIEYVSTITSWVISNLLSFMGSRGSKIPDTHRSTGGQG